MSEFVVSERNKSLFEARERDGLTFRQLATRFGIGHERAQQIYHRTREVLEREALDGDTVSTSRLSVRARNCLKNAGIGEGTREQVRLWVSNFPHELVKVKNLGRHTAAEIRAWVGVTNERDHP